MSEVLEICGGATLEGNVTISGAKNAALPILISCLLSSERCEITNVPSLEDVRLTLELLEHFGAQTSFAKGTASVAVPILRATDASYSLVKALRASFWVLAPLLARGRAARVALPGGDAIGARPVDMHLAGLTQMGAEITLKHGVVYATAQKGLKAADIHLRFPSVGATHQIMMAAAITKGTTLITNAAREPEVVAVADFLNTLGADIEGAGSERIVVRGVDGLGGGTFKLIGDRIEAGTYLMAAAATRGSVTLNGIEAHLLGAFLETLSELGLSITVDKDTIQLSALHRIKPVNVSTAPFPGFATDLQAPLMAALCYADGTSTIEEHIFEGRFGHVSELCRLGAQIQIQEHTATIIGQEKLTAAPVSGLDIRAAASLVIAALGAEGTTILNDPFHLKRGYERFDQKLRSLGAKVSYRVVDPEDYLFVGC